MASRRAILSASALRLSSVVQRTRTFHAGRRNAVWQVSGHGRAFRPGYVPVRWHSAPAESSVIDYAVVKQYSESPQSDRIIIDVREPAEYEEGFIPGAINIPIKSQPDALLLPPDEFEGRFGFPKPDKEKELVFYCLGGVRASAAAQLAAQNGYKKVKEYRGSWKDWQKNGGTEARPGMSTGTRTGT
ncbi:MAG: hypothetical protein FE78DRAFT_165849 [Acidomyces sp. 'richmondensis']|nr:MAG: hypothetical protein FE78DRAFT_165849 [Acidomyces sp. 'richmondensis']